MSELPLRLRRRHLGVGNVLRGSKMNVRRGGALTLLALVAMIVAACGSSNSSGGGGGGGGGSSASTTKPKDHSGPYRVLVITSLSGPIGPFGEQELVGAKAAQSVLNAQGGINGHKVQLTIKDSGGDSTKAVTLLQQALTSGKKPDLVIPGVLPIEGVAMTPITTANKILTISSEPAPEIGDAAKAPYSFDVNPAYSLVGKWTADAVFKRGVKTVSTVSPDDSPGKSETDGFKAEFEKLGGKIVDQEKFAPTTLDLTGVFGKAAAAHPQGFFVVDEGQGVPEVKAHYAVAPTIPFFCDIGCILPMASQVGGVKALKHTFGMGQPIIVTKAANRTPRQQDYVKTIQAQGFNIKNGVELPSLDYDEFMIVAQAAKQANSIDGPTVAKALENLQGDPEWALGYPLHFSATSHFPQQPDDPAAVKLFPLDAPFQDGSFGVY